MRFFGSIGDYVDVAAIIAAQDNRCTYCEVVFAEPEPPGAPPKYRGNGATIDHRVPVWRGGAFDGPENCTAACASCNKDKGSLTEVEFRFYRVQSKKLLKQARVYLDQEWNRHVHQHRLRGMKAPPLRHYDLVTNAEFIKALPMLGANGVEAQRRNIERIVSMSLPRLLWGRTRGMVFILLKSIRAQWRGQRVGRKYDFGSYTRKFLKIMRHRSK